MALTAAFRKRLGPRDGAASFALDVDLRLESGCTVLLGPSGSGKTTLLRCLAGLERPEQGLIRFGPETWFDSEGRIHRAPQRRKLGLVFSDFALFPRMTVRANVAYAGADAARVSELLERFELGDLAARMPAQLSAGQQQRVALARALAADPCLLLMDEPFSALDAPLRDRLVEFLLPMLAELGIPVLWVTHDRDEACRVAESLLLLDQGRVIARGNSRDLFERPGTSRAAELLGLRNRFSSRQLAADRLQWGPWELEVTPGATYAAWGIAAERVHWVEPEDEGRNRVMAIVRDSRPTVQGHWIRAEVPGAGTIEASLAFRDGTPRELAAGMTIGLRIPRSAIYALESPD
jgi:molybdate transport system ATP-binding protein